MTNGREACLAMAKNAFDFLIRTGKSGTITLYYYII